MKATVHYIRYHQLQVVMNLVGLEMAGVKMKTTMKHASLMVETVVGPILSYHFAQNVNALMMILL